jgi:hypothetical protein
MLYVIVCVGKLYINECLQEGAEETATLMLVGNKVDLSEDSDMRVVKTEDGKNLAKVMPYLGLHVVYHSYLGLPVI